MTEMSCGHQKLKIYLAHCLQLYFVKFTFHKENVTMKSKRLFQIFILLILLVSTAGMSQPVKAQTDDPIIINRNLSIWDATFIGFVSSSIYEQWHFEFTESHNFTVTVNTVAGDLVPLLILQDSNGAEITRSTGSLTSTQSAGNYSIQVQPESGSGFYVLTIRENIITPPPSASVTTSVTPSSVNVGESAVVTVSLNNVPAEGYTSAEFTCTYNANLVEASNIVVTSLFGADAAVAINGPQNGSFIVAIAGSNGNKATTSGAAFTFSVLGLQAGQTAIECTVRVSKGDNVLTSLPSTGTSLTVVGSLPTATFTPTPADTATPTSSTPVDTATPTSLTPVDTATPTSLTPVDTATPTSLTPVDTATPTSSTPVDTATPTSSTPVETATPTSSTPVGSPTPTALPNGTLTGQVLASKPVTVSLYDASSTLVTSVTANPDGTFSLTAPAGSYTVLATASGFLSAQGSATITGGSTSTKPTITLLAGDIDGNNVIDQFDALTIGMNYNAAVPTAADLNNDGVINVLDLELLAANYRKTGPQAWEISYP
jgi:Carboxypeptidase regulatory-like domain/Cohesin domain